MKTKKKTFTCPFCGEKSVLSQHLTDCAVKFVSELSIIQKNKIIELLSDNEQYKENISSYLNIPTYIVDRVLSIFKKQNNIVFKKTTKCPFCGETILEGNGHHIKHCQHEYVASLSNEVKKKIKILYEEQEYSVLDICNFLNETYNEKFPNKQLKYSNAQKILVELGYKLRNIKESITDKRKEKYEETCMEHFGTIHNFDKNCPSRKEWEERLFKEEGIINVFQRESVKKKIIETSIEHFGENYKNVVNSKDYLIQKWIKDGATEEEALSHYKKMCYDKGKYFRKNYFIEKYGDEEGIKKFIERCMQLRQKQYDVDQRTGTSISSLNKRFKKMLDSFNIEYESEYPIQNNIKDDKRYMCYYDFRIGSLIFEINGDFWHANPLKYKPDDLINYPTPGPRLAKDIWKDDEFKKNLAESKGFQVIVIWEYQMNDQEQWNEIINIFRKYAEKLKNQENRENREE